MNKPFDNRDNDAEIERQTYTRKARIENGGEAEPGSASRTSKLFSHPVVRISLFLIFCLAISLLGRGAVNMIYSTMHSYPFSQVPYASPYWQIFLPLTGAIGALAALVLMKRREGWALWRSTGFGIQGAGRAVLVGLSASAVVSFINLGVSSIINSRYSPTSAATPHFFPLLLAYSLVFSILRIVSSETIFHGFILQELEKRWGTLVGLVVSSLFFGIYVNWYWINPAFYHDYSIPWLLSLLYGLFGNLASAIFLASLYLYTRSLWAPITCSITSWFLLSGTSLALHFSPNFAVLRLGEIVAASWLIVLAIQNGQWKPGPGPRQIAQATYAGVLKVIDMTDPGKEVDAETTPQHTSE